MLSEGVAARLGTVDKIGDGRGSLGDGASLDFDHPFHATRRSSRRSRCDPRALVRRTGQVLDGIGDEAMNDLVRRTVDGTTHVAAEPPAQTRTRTAE